MMALKADIMFEDMVSKIMKNHPIVASSNEAIKGADASLDSAFWQYFPTPSVGLSRNGRASQTSAKLEQPIWAGGRIDATYNQALASKNEALFDLDEKKRKLLETILTHTQNYIDARYSKEALMEGLTRLEGFSEMINRKIGAGVASLSDKRLLQARITQIKTDIISNQFKEEISLKQLSILMGEEIDKINFKDKFSLEDMDKNELLKKVTLYDPTLAKVEEQIKIAGYEIEKQEANLYPSLSVSAEHITGNIYDEKSNTKDNVVYLKLQSTFGAGLSLFSNIEQAKIKQQKLKYDKLSYESELANIFWQDYNNMMVSKSKISNYDVNKELSNDVFESNKRLFLADKKQWLDLVNSSKELMDIDISSASTKVMYMISKYKVAIRTGLINIDNGQYYKEKTSGMAFIDQLKNNEE